uniref:Putative ml domain salivary peptide n=1 Tax=Nyssomyia neivai TaxID=330878 RepID=A0A1L8DQG4_9DIPT
MIRYLFLIALIPATVFATLWYRPFWVVNCKGVNGPLDISVDECPPYNICYRIWKSDTKSARVHVNFKFSLDREYTKLPISTDYYRYSDGKVVQLLPETDACGTFIKCPLKPGTHTIKVPVTIRDKVEWGEFLYVGLHINGTSNDRLVCAYVGFYANR